MSDLHQQLMDETRPDQFQPGSAYSPLDFDRYRAALRVIAELHTPVQGQPTPSPEPGICGTCGGTGVIHGPGGNGNWTDEPCGCDGEWCTECEGATWPCRTIDAIAEALGIDPSARAAGEQEHTG